MSDHSGFKPPDDDTGHDDVHDDAEGIRRRRAVRARCRTGPSRRPARCRGCSSTKSPPQPDEDLEAWSSFAATPRWRSSADDWDDDTDIAEFGDSETRIGALDSGADQSSRACSCSTTRPSRPTDPAPAVTPIRTGHAQRACAGASTRRSRSRRRLPGAESTTARKQPAPPNRPGGGGPADTGGPAADRDLPVAIGVGVALAVVALVLFSIGPGAAMGLVTLGDRCRRGRVLRRDAEGRRTARRRCSASSRAQACRSRPYWRGEGAIPLVLVLSVVFGLLWFLLRRGRRAGRCRTSR